MATIADLHTSISDMSDEAVFIHIRHLRSLRRELPVKTARKTARKITKKENKNQITFEEYLNKIRGTKREELLKKLIELKKGR